MITETGRRTGWWSRGGATEASAHTGFVRLALGAVLCGIAASALLHAAARADQDDASILALVREAVIAATTNLRTGRANGSFRLWGPKNELSERVRFRGAFDGSKHYLTLNYEPPQPDVPLLWDKRIVVCDGSDVFVSEFSDRIHPVGAEGAVYRQKRGGALRHATLGFPSDLKGLATGVLSPETLDKYAVELERLPNGHYLGKYQVSPTYHTTLEVAPEYGYHCILAESRSRGALANRWTVSWKLADDVWYATGCKKERYSDGKHVETYEWRFDEFEANVPVSSELFTLNALELPGGARILDRRAEGPLLTDSGEPRMHKVKIYRLPDAEPKPGQKQVDRLIEQIEAMPMPYEAKQITSAWRRRIWGVSIGILGIVAIALMWFFYQRKARSGIRGAS